MIGDRACRNETYKKIDDKKSESWDVTNAWLGITDKYWAAALLPDTDAQGPRALLRRRQRHG